MIITLVLPCILLLDLTTAVARRHWTRHADELQDCTLRIFRGYDFSIFITSLSLERHFGGFDPDLEPASVRLVMECPPGIMMMMNVSEIKFETSFLTVLDYVIYHFSLTRKCIPVVYIFVPIITLSV